MECSKNTWLEHFAGVTIMIGYEVIFDRLSCSQARMRQGSLPSDKKDLCEQYHYMDCFHLSFI